MTPHQLYTAAKTDKDTYNNLMRSGHIGHWDRDDEHDFAVRFGFFAALRAVGMDKEKAVSYADVFAESKKLPTWLVINPLDGEEAYFSSPGFGDTPVAGLCLTVAGGEGRQVIGDEDPFADAEKPEPADVVVAINLYRIRSRMLSLFK